MGAVRERIPLGFSGTKGRSSAAGAQALVNLYAEPVEREGRTALQLLPWPGKSAFATVGGVMRGLLEVGDTMFAVVGESLYTVDSSGAATTIGTVEGANLVDMDSNGSQLVIVADIKTYSVTLSGLTLSEVIDADFVAATSVTSINGYSITTRGGSDAFQWSSLRDASAWAALDYATAESNPDALVCARAVNKELVLLGKKTIEFWYNSGNPSQAFEPRSVAPLEVGCLSRNSTVVVDGQLFFVGRDGRAGGVGVYRLAGYQVQKISTPAIDRWLHDYAAISATSIASARAFAFQFFGHAFYVLTLPGTVTLVYDLSTQVWLPYVRTGTYSQNAEPGGVWDAIVFATNGQKLIVGASDGNLYQLSDTTFTDAGAAIVREVLMPQISKGGLGFTVHRVEADIEAGVGLTSGQGSSPVMLMNQSRDGGRNWTEPRECSMGAMGDYVRRVFWNICGYARNTILRFRVTDPVKTVWLGSVAEIETHRS